jgi:hypothetical protein
VPISHDSCRKWPGQRSGPGLADGTRADAGQQAAGTPGAGPADRVAVVADEPLDAACHGHIVQGQSAAVPWGERNGDAITAEVDGRLATGNGSVIGYPADEPRRSTEVVEVPRIELTLSAQSATSSRSVARIHVTSKASATTR